MAVFAPPGVLVFRRESALMMQRFDTERLELLGEPISFGEEVGGAAHNIFGEASFSVSAAGVLAFRATGSDALSELAWYERSGERIAAAGPPASYSDVALSPDGRTVAYGRQSLESGTDTLWLHDLGRGVTSRLTFEYDWAPVFSPGGDRVAFGSLRQGLSDIFVESIPTGEVAVVLDTDDLLGPTDWTADGELIVYTNLSTSDVGVVPAAGGEPALILDSEFVEKDGNVSPDGKWIAHTSNESGRWEVYVRSFPELVGKRQVSRDGGSHPRWRGDGKELFYLALDQGVMSVPIAGVTPFEPGAPEVLLDAPVVGHPFKLLYDVTADGRRILAITPTETDSPPVTIALNWARLLQD